MNDSEGWNRRVRRGRNKQQKSIVTVTETTPVAVTVALSLLSFVLVLFPSTEMARKFVMLYRRVASSRDTFCKALFESGSSEYQRANSIASNEMRRHARPIPRNPKVLY